MPSFSWDALLETAGDAAKEFEPIPDGPQNFVISKTEIVKSKSDKTGISITAIIESGPHAKRRVWHTWYISPESPKALAYFFREMNIFGLDNSFWGAKPDDNKIIAGMNNKRFVGTLKTEEYQGKKKNVIDGFAAPVGSALGNAAATLAQGGSAGGGPSGPSAGPAAAPPAAAAPAPTPQVAAAQPAPVAAPPAAPAPQAAPPAPVAAPPAAPVAEAAPPAAHENPWETPPPAPAVAATTPPPVPNIPGA